MKDNDDQLIFYARGKRIDKLLEDHPNCPVTRTQGESAIRLEIQTFSTISQRTISNQTTRRLKSKKLTLVTENVLDGSSKILELLSLSLSGSLLLISLLQLESILGNANELLVLEFLELSSSVFVDRVDHEEDLEVLLLEDLEEGRVSDLREGFSGEVVDVLLLFGHSSDVVCASVASVSSREGRKERRTLERGHLLARFGRVESEEFSELASVLRILVDAELDVLSEGLVKLGEAAQTIISHQTRKQENRRLTCPCPQRYRRASPSSS